MSKMSITFDGFSDLANAVDKSGADLKKAVDDALTQTQQLIEDNLVTAADVYAHKGLKGYATGAMYKTIIKNSKVEWTGTVASVDAGFKLREKGGFHSIFVMYGTPRIAKDVKLYNAIKGTKTQKEIAELQQKVMSEYVNINRS